MRLSSLFLLFTALGCHAPEAYCDGKPPIKIAIIDTGFGFGDLGHEAHLCKYGHKDFSGDRQFTKNYATKTPIPLDLHGHGTNVAGIIDTYAKGGHANYCLVIIKYYSEKQTGRQNLLATIRAFNYATILKANVVNYSGGGYDAVNMERVAVLRYLNQGGKLIAAAGNERKNLDVKDNEYYPALYDKRIVVVGNNSENGTRSYTSNYGKRVTRWEVGENVTAFGLTMTGTSQATAVATGKIVAENPNKCDIGR